MKSQSDPKQPVLMDDNTKKVRLEGPRAPKFDDQMVLQY